MEFYTRKLCETCGGEGIRIHPRWEMFWEKIPEGEASQDQEREWFSEEGFDEPPDIEINCDACDGKRYIYSWVKFEGADR